MRILLGGYRLIISLCHSFRGWGGHLSASYDAWEAELRENFVFADDHVKRSEAPEQLLKMDLLVTKVQVTISKFKTGKTTI